jgi:signal peptide peptidase SppA
MKIRNDMDRAIAATCWAIDMDYLSRAVSEYRAHGDRAVNADALLYADDAAIPRNISRASGSVAVLPVNGPIMQKPDLWMRLFGIGTSTEGLGRAIDTLVNDPSVKAIVLDVDSPGGSVSGVEELGDKIREARDRKPIIASANAFMASAAYHIGASASEVVASPSALVGSIGVWRMHVDFSEALEADGIAVTLISAGEKKVDGNQFEPLSERALADAQAQVDSYYATFVDAVAAGREVSPADVRGGFGRGGMVRSAEAKRLGMVDRVETFDQTLARLGAGAQNAGRAAAQADAERIALSIR